MTCALGYEFIQFGKSLWTNGTNSFNPFLFLEFFDCGFSFRAIIAGDQSFRIEIGIFVGEKLLKSFDVITTRTTNQSLRELHFCFDLFKGGVCL